MDHSPPDLLLGARDVEQHTIPAIGPEPTRPSAGGQPPSRLVITCSEVPAAPNVIAGSRPGGLLTVRNVGNLVPAGYAEHAVGAAIEYAVAVLRVRTITVCGHSGCGAMQSLMHGAHRRAGPAGTPLTRWLRNGQDALHRARTAPARIAGREDADPLERLCLTNIAQQLDNLRAHPVVRARVAAGSLVLAGLYLDPAASQAYLLSADGRFTPVPRPGAGPAAWYWSTPFDRQGLSAGRPAW